VPDAFGDLASRAVMRETDGCLASVAQIDELVPGMLYIQ
jgi:hypothetical protein